MAVGGGGGARLLGLAVSGGGGAGLRLAVATAGHGLLGLAVGGGGGARLLGLAVTGSGLLLTVGRCPSHLRGLLTVAHGGVRLAIPGSGLRLTVGARQGCHVLVARERLLALHKGSINESG